MYTTQNDHIRPIDQTVLELLRHGDGWTVTELTSELGVTATAVRQRLERLVEMDLIHRKKESIGRGRPLFRYCLTKAGTRFASVSYSDLAAALWEEVLDLPDPKQRAGILRRVAKKLGADLKETIPQSADLNERLVATASALARRKVQAVVNETGDLPVLEVQSCPYPELTDADDRRQLCEVEQEMISEAIGQSVQLDCCRLDGHSLCQFKPIDAAEQLT